jgi:SAM-dependent methyltransferase
MSFEPVNQASARYGKRCETGKNMLEEVSCNICGKSETEFMFELIEDITGEDQAFPLVRCRSCDLVFVNPRPTRGGIARYYPEDSYYSYRFQDQTTLKRRIRNYVLEEQGGYPHSGKDGIAVRIFGKLLATLTKGQILMYVPSRPNGKALDIGCGCGDLLLWLKRHGWSETHGVELSQGAADLANKNGLTVFCGEFVHARYPDHYFDFISLSQVLEHMHDPMLILKEARRILKPDGLLVIGVPNFDSYENAVFGKHQSILKEVPRHLYHFSRKTMTRMLDESGFRVDRIAGKTFFIPTVNRQSLKLVLKNESQMKFFGAVYRIVVMRPLRYFLSREKETFGQLFTFYATKKS